MYDVIIFAVGVVTGCVLLRYGYGLGVKAVYQIKQDRLLNDEDGGEIIQSNTADEIEEN